MTNAEITLSPEQGEIPVCITLMPDDISSATASILINAPRDRVWSTVTDYDNLQNTLPNVAESHLLQREGNECILEQTGRVGILIFEMKVHFVLRIHEEPLESITFEQITGDFSIYQGQWELEESGDGSRTILHYRAKLKPLFPVPHFLVHFVQRQDLPQILKAHKKTAESMV